MRSVRGVITSLYTVGQRKHITTYFLANNANLFSAIHDHADWIIFVVVYPSNSWSDFLETMRQTTLTAIDLDTLDMNSHEAVTLGTPMRLALLRSHGAVAYRAPCGMPIFAVPLVVNLPTYYERNARPFARPRFSTCVGQVWSLEYALYSGSAFPSQVLQHAVLDGYDYWMKMDLDIKFTHRVPVSPFLLMAQSSCLWLHTRLDRETERRRDSCQRFAFEATHKYARIASVQPQSWRTTWYEDPSVLSFGNLVGGWLGMLRSPEALRFLDYMYNGDSEFQGYFRARWTDQAPFAKLIGMFLPLTDDDITQHNLERFSNGNTSTHGLCSLVSWRDKLFEHVKLV